MVEWCLPQDIDLEGVEFKSMASGSHKVQSDFMWVFHMTPSLLCSPHVIRRCPQIVCVRLLCVYPVSQQEGLQLSSSQWVRTFQHLQLNYYSMCGPRGGSVLVSERSLSSVWVNLRRLYDKLGILALSKPVLVMCKWCMVNLVRSQWTRLKGDL